MDGEPSAVLEKSEAGVPLVSPLDISICNLVQVQTPLHNMPGIWSSLAYTITFWLIVALVVTIEAIVTKHLLER